MTAGKYEPLSKIASGGTATVFVGAAKGAHGFRQLVAIKRPHAHLADDRAFRDALLAEARIASRIHHANVVDVRDVEESGGSVDLVMDFVDGASLADLIRSWIEEPPARPAATALRIVLDACEGLHAAHELADEDGRPLGLVHRDVSPQNVLVGVDGVARITDFGLAKPLQAMDRGTSDGMLRGKLGYMAPEYVKGGRAIDRRVDVFAIGVVAWEALAERRLFRGENDGDTLERVKSADVPSLVELAPGLSPAAARALDAVLATALARAPEERFPTARAFAAALEDVAREHELAATHAEVAASFGPKLRARVDAQRREVRAKLASLDAAPADAADVAPPPADARGRGTGRLLGAVIAIVVVGALGAIVAAIAVAWRARPEAERARMSEKSPAENVQSAPNGAAPSASAAGGAAPSASSTEIDVDFESPTSAPRTRRPPTPPDRRHPRPNPYGQ